MTELKKKEQSVKGEECPCKIPQRQMVEIRATATAKASLHSWYKGRTVSLS